MEKRIIDSEFGKFITVSHERIRVEARKGSLYTLVRDSNGSVIGLDKDEFRSLYDMMGEVLKELDK